MISTDKDKELSLFSISTAAKQLKVGKKRIYDMIDKGEIGVIEFDTGAIKIPQSELTRWVLERITYKNNEISKQNGTIRKEHSSFDAKSIISKAISKERKK